MRGRRRRLLNVADKWPRPPKLEVADSVCARFLPRVRSWVVTMVNSSDSPYEEHLSITHPPCVERTTEPRVMPKPRQDSACPGLANRSLHLRQHQRKARAVSDLDLRTVTMKTMLLEVASAVALPTLMRKTLLLALPSRCRPTSRQSAAFPSVEAKIQIPPICPTLKTKLALVRRRLLLGEPALSLLSLVNLTSTQPWRLPNATLQP